MAFLSNLKPAKGSNQRSKTIGRGNASGHGGTSTKGHKGQKSRSGPLPHPGFEGGQMPIHRRSPKWGFNNKVHRVEYTVVNLDQLEQWFNSGEAVTLESCVEKGVFSSSAQPLKILGRGKLTKALTVRARASESAKKAIEAAKGKVEDLTAKKSA